MEMIYVIVQRGLSIVTGFSKSSAWVASKSEPQCRLWVLGGYDVAMQVHSFNTLVWALKMETAMNVTGQGLFGNSLKVPLNLVMNLKLLLCLKIPTEK